MTHCAPLPFRDLIEVLTDIQNQEDLSIRVEPAVFLTVHKLAGESNCRCSTLAQFLLAKTNRWQISEAILTVLLPESVTELRQQIPGFQKEKEAAVSAMDFERAKRIKKEMTCLRRRIPEACGETYAVTFRHVEAALRRLGFTEELNI